MSIIDDCVQFLEDLILGDFNDQQVVSAQVIGGLTSLIPVMDQVMDVRDIYGAISKSLQGWQNEYRKINDGGIPTALCAPKNIVNQNGIDAAWFTNRKIPRQFAIVEAKTSMNPKPKLISLLKDADETLRPQGAKKSKRGNRAGREETSSMTSSATGSKRREARRVLQMSHRWIEERLKWHMPRWRARAMLNYSRHVFLVTPVQVSDHIVAGQKIIESGCINNPKKAQKFAASHSNHLLQCEYGEAEIDAAEAQYKVSGLPEKNVGGVMEAKNDVEIKRRQPYVTSRSYENTLRKFDEDYLILDEKLASVVGNPVSRSSLLGTRAITHWNVFQLKFTAGIDLEECAKQLSNTVDEYEAYARELDAVPDDDYYPPFDLEDLIDTYLCYLHLLSSAVLLHREDLVPRIYSLIEGTDYDGADVVIEELLKFFLPDRPQVDEWLWGRPYGHLVKVFDNPDPDKRSNRMREFVRSWYREMKGEALFWGTHEQVEDDFSPYFGYWAMCAAAFTYLYNIDDSSYRDEMVYPRDLVDYARSKPRNPVALDGELILRVLGSQACPRSGTWFSPARSDSTRYFNLGEVMPEFSTSEYGATIWQWMSE